MTPEARDTSRLGEGAEANGRLSGSGSVEILGFLSGEVDWSGLIVVGPEGKLEASGKVRSIELFGVVHGRLDVEQEVLVREGARWSGGCSAPSMTTEAGAWIEGEFKVRPVRVEERSDS